MNPSHLSVERVCIQVCGMWCIGLNPNVKRKRHCSVFAHVCAKHCSRHTLEMLGEQMTLFRGVLSESWASLVPLQNVPSPLS